METVPRHNRLVLWVVAAAIAFVAASWILTRRAAPGHSAPSANATGALSPTPPSPAKAREVERSQLADELNAPGGTIRQDLQIVAAVLEAFRTNFPHTGNPVGDNAEITAALTGRNQLRLALIPPDHPAINAAGELCDRWGTPFFFHAESGTHMAIRSAGPDRKMWTADDIVSEP